MHLSIHIVINPTYRTHLENSFESIEKPFARKHISSINHLISTAKNTKNPFEPPIENKINQFHRIHICINLKKSIQDIRNKKSITLLTPKLNLNLGLHSNLTQNSNKSDVNWNRRFTQTQLCTCMSKGCRIRHESLGNSWNSPDKQGNEVR